MNSLI